MRHAIAELFERQPLEHDIGRAAIGGRASFPCFASIRLSGSWPSVAAVQAVVDVGEVERLAVRPDAADARDRPLAEPDREIGEVASSA